MMLSWAVLSHVVTPPAISACSPELPLRCRSTPHTRLPLPKTQTRVLFFLTPCGASGVLSRAAIAPLHDPHVRRRLPSSSRPYPPRGFVLKRCRRCNKRHGDTACEPAQDDTAVKATLTLHSAPRVGEPQAMPTRQPFITRSSDSLAAPQEPARSAEHAAADARSRPVPHRNGAFAVPTLLAVAQQQARRPPVPSCVLPPQ